LSEKRILDAVQENSRLLIGEISKENENTVKQIELMKNEILGNLADINKEVQEHREAVISLKNLAIENGCENESGEPGEKERNLQMISFIEKSVILSQAMERKGETAYVVRCEHLNLYASSGGTGDVVGVVYYNQKVYLADGRKKWIKVQYFDLVKRCEVRGWVRKKYLKRIE